MRHNFWSVYWSIWWRVVVMLLVWPVIALWNQAHQAPFIRWPDGSVSAW